MITTAVLAFGVCGWAGSLRAQAGGDDDKEWAEHIYEQRAGDVLKRFYDPGDFIVEAELTLKEGVQPEKIGYLPRSAAAEFGASKSLHPLDKGVEKLALTVYLRNTDGKESETTLRKLLTKKLLVKTDRGDSITFSKLLVTKSRDESSQAQERVQQLEKELSEANRKLTVEETTRSQVEAHARQLEAKVERVEKGDSDPGVVDKAKNAAEADRIGLWIRYGLIGAAILACIVVGLLLSGALRRIGHSLSEGLKAIGSGMQQARDNALPEAPREPVRLLDNAATPSPGPTGEYSHVQSVYERLTALNTELLSLLNAKTEAIVLWYVTNLLASEATTAKALYSLEVLGADTANRLFNRLGPNERARALTFLKHGHVSQPKPLLMLESGEELKTRLMAFGQDLTKLTEATCLLYEELLKASQQDLASAVRSLEGPEVARLLFHMEPAKIADIINQMKRTDALSMEKIIDQLPAIAASADAVEGDAKILTTLQSATQAGDAIKQRFYVPYYQSLIEGVDDQVSEKILTSLARSEVYKREIVDKHVSPLTFFKLSAKLRGDILAALGASDITAFCLSVTAEERASVVNELAGTKLDIVNENLATAEANPASLRKFVGRSADVRKAVVAQIKAMMAAGEWSVGSPSDAAPSIQNIDNAA